MFFCLMRKGYSGYTYATLNQKFFADYIFQNYYQKCVKDV